MQIGPTRDIIVVVVAALDALYAIDPNNPDRQIIPLTFFGDKPLISEYAALEYAPNLDRLVYYSANDGPHLYSIAAHREPRLTDNPWNGRLSLMKTG